MQKTLRVLIVIAIVLCLVMFFDLITELIPTGQPPTDSYAIRYAQEALINWLVFWPAGLVLLCVGIVLRRNYSILGNSLAIGGVYLMLLGNNGGLWSRGYELWRLITSIISLAILLLIAVKLDRQRAITSHRDNDGSSEADSAGTYQIGV